jgi:hypothetical protein
MLRHRSRKDMDGKPIGLRTLDASEPKAYQDDFRIPNRSRRSTRCHHRGVAGLLGRKSENISNADDDCQSEWIGVGHYRAFHYRGGLSRIVEQQHGKDKTVVCTENSIRPRRSKRTA